MNPKISVLVPIYNVESYIKRCVNSVLRQCFTDWELILVDDGSPDDSPTICDEYAKNDARISVIHKKNGGLPSARLCGFKAAKGSFWCFLMQMIGCMIMLFRYYMIISFLTVDMILLKVLSAEKSHLEING